VACKLHDFFQKKKPMQLKMILLNCCLHMSHACPESQCKAGEKEMYLR
jgi:hypothetical protein